MKLLPDSIAKILPPLYSQENEQDPVAVVKYFLGSWTWYVVEGEKEEDGDALLFGKVVGMETELGYFRLSELKSVKIDNMCTVERDLYFKPKPLSQCK